MSGMACIIRMNRMTINEMTGMIWMTGMTCMIRMNRINLVPRVLSYPSLQSERERETLIGSGHVAPEQN